ncbi:guanine nucleotide-binding protein G(o) subunit alpha [Trichonephila clavipes]|nr:guanine nucleotide-binding protein G(o) subunit alpha [Trichonephila clavipes]
MNTKILLFISVVYREYKGLLQSQILGPKPEYVLGVGQFLGLPAMQGSRGLEVWFKAENFDIEDEPPSSHPIEVDCDQLKQFIAQDRSVSTRTIAIIHDSGFTQEDFKQYKPVVYSNTIQSMVAILRAMPNLGIGFGNNEREISVQYMSQRELISIEEVPNFYTTLRSVATVQSCGTGQGF